MTLADHLAGVPLDRVVQLRGADLNTVALTIAEDLTDIAAVVATGPTAHATPVDAVDAALRDLELAAVALLPAWLPDVTGVDRPDAGGAAAVRMAATTHARRERYHLPFLVDLAVFGLTGRRNARPAISRRIRGAELARVVAEGFGRRRTVLLVPLAAGLTAGEQETIVAGSDWLAQNARTGVWLLGAPLTEVDRVPMMELCPPARAGRETAASWSAAIGKPHPASAIEAALEAALSAESWAAGRTWNQSYQSNALTAPVRLDLCWWEERCVVELDGPEHCHPVRFEADRQRDVLLQLDGYAVLRFTNARITHDIGAVVHQIGTYLQGRRQNRAEGRTHGRG